MQAERAVGCWVYLDPQSMSNNGLQTYVHSSWAGMLTVGIKVSGFRSYRLRVGIRIGVYVLGFAIRASMFTGNQGLGSGPTV